MRRATADTLRGMNAIRGHLGRVRRATRDVPIALRACGRSVRRKVRTVGRCPICAATSRQPRTVFGLTCESLRECLQCMRCRSNSRNRAVMLLVQQHVPHWRTADIFEAGAGSALTNALSSAARGHIASQLLPAVVRGEVVRGIRSEDLESLTLATESVDLVITEDVMEHVFHPDRAFREIERILRPGGFHIFTVPFHSDKDRSVTRATVDKSGTVTHLLPPEYHGDPLDDAGVLAVTDFAADLPRLISGWSDLTTSVVEVHDPPSGVAQPCAVFVSSKPGSRPSR